MLSREYASPWIAESPFAKVGRAVRESGYCVGKEGERTEKGHPEIGRDSTGRSIFLQDV